MGLRGALRVIILISLLGGSAEWVTASESEKNPVGETHETQHPPKHLSPAERVYMSCIKEGAETAECNKKRRARALIEMEQRQAEERRTEWEKALQREREAEQRELEQQRQRELEQERKDDEQALQLLLRALERLEREAEQMRQEDRQERLPQIEEEKLQIEEEKLRILRRLGR